MEAILRPPHRSDRLRGFPSVGIARPVTRRLHYNLRECVDPGRGPIGREGQVCALHTHARSTLFRGCNGEIFEIEKVPYRNHYSMSKGEADNIVSFKGGVDEFKAQVTEYQGMVVANFWAQWCAPCRRLAGMLPQIASENPKVKFIKIDVDENPELAEAYEITGIPNVRLFKGSATHVDEIQGLDNAALREAIAKHSK
jgi:thioredoxin 1